MTLTSEIFKSEQAPEKGVNKDSLGKSLHIGNFEMYQPTIYEFIGTGRPFTVSIINAQVGYNTSKTTNIEEIKPTEVTGDMPHIENVDQN